MEIKQRIDGVTIYHNIHDPLAGLRLFGNAKASRERLEKKKPIIVLSESEKQEILQNFIDKHSPESNLSEKKNGNNDK